MKHKHKRKSFHSDYSEQEWKDNVEIAKWSITLFSLIFGTYTVICIVEEIFLK